MNVMAQIFGILGLLVMVRSYLNSHKKDFLFKQIFANLFYALQYLFLMAFSGMFITFISILRSILFYEYEVRNKDNSVNILIMFLISFIVAGILTFEGVISLIPIFIAVIYTYGAWQKKLSVTYTIGIVVSVLWLIYNYLVGAYFGFIGSIFEFVAASIGLHKILSKRNV